MIGPEKKQQEMAAAHFNLLQKYIAKPYPGNAIIVHYTDPNERLTQRWSLICENKSETMYIPNSKHHEILIKGMDEIIEKFSAFPSNI